MGSANDRLRTAPPGARFLDRRIEKIDPETGEVTARFRSRSEFANRHGTVSGGFLAAMLDSTVGLATLATLAPEETAMTLELKVSYLRPAPIAELIGIGRVIHRGRSVAFTEGELRNESDEVVAKGTATMRIIRDEDS
jgi:uncharacterized protein (TIGR00369 family)